jgi:TniQ
MNWAAARLLRWSSLFCRPAAVSIAWRQLASGTPEVESLTGYISRLAKAHCVTVGTLLSKEFDGKLAYKDICLGSSNGIAPIAASCVRAVESLTHRNDLRNMTMLSWANTLSSKGLLRSYRAWCPICLREHPTVYEPLLWCIGAVEACPQHGRRLTSRCPHCSETLPVLGSNMWPGQCSKCRCYLDDDSVISASNKAASFHQLWTAIAVGEMLAASQDEPLPSGRFMEALRFWTQDATFAETGRLLEEPDATVRRWLIGRSLPKLGTLVEICHKLETSPLPFLTLALPASHCKRIGPPCAQAKRPNGRRKIDLTEIRVELEATLRNIADRPPSTAEVSRRMCYSKWTLYKYFPELCRAISRRYMDWRIECGVRREQALIEEVRRIAASLYEVGTEPNNREVFSRMTKPGSFRNPIVAAALTRIRLELGPAGRKSSFLRQGQPATDEKLIKETGNQREFSVSPSQPTRDPIGTGRYAA